MTTYHSVIRIVKGGPYHVTGNVPIKEVRIVLRGGDYFYEEGRPLPQADTYSLCRCGCSKNKPFCDGAHRKADFRGRETASKLPYLRRAKRQRGATVDLLDDGRCALARSCHTSRGDVWMLTAYSTQEESRQRVIDAAISCPAGRLTAVDKASGGLLETPFPPCIEALQDENGPACLSVKGGILLEGADKDTYEIRNRMALCRCGLSKNKPFCDGKHTLP